MRRILVTGGFGFVGGHLIDVLTQDNTNAVHVVDNLSSSPIPYSILLAELGSRPNLTYDIASVRDYCRASPCSEWDQVYHLASVVGPAGVLRHAGQITRTIVEDTYLMMDLAERAGARLLDVSTSEVYGGGQDGYCSEDLPKIVPAKTTVRLEYAVAKLACETSLINATAVSRLDVVIVRPFNISGPRQSGVGGFVLPRFIALAMSNLPLTVFGDGRQLRAFTHVRDIAEGLVAAMEHGATATCYNLGNPSNRTSIDALADLVIEVTGSGSQKVYIDPKTIYGPLYAEASDKYPNADLAFRELEWRPRFRIPDIVKQTLQYMRQLPADVLATVAGIHEPA